VCEVGWIKLQVVNEGELQMLKQISGLVQQAKSLESSLTQTTKKKLEN
jgi:hypothetical protein